MPRGLGFGECVRVPLSCSVWTNPWYLPQVNPGRVGYYRVNYSNAMFEKLFVALKNGQLGERDRLAIQEDASALVS